MIKEDLNIIIRLLDVCTINQQVLIYQSAFNHQMDFESMKEQWIQKHYSNPVQNSFIFGAFIDGNLVGMNAYLPTIFRMGEKNILCVQSCESAVAPNYQGRGIWSKVVKYALDYLYEQTNCQFVFGFPNYTNSYPGFVKMNWKTLLNMNNYILINNGHSFSESFVGKPKIIRRILQMGSIQKMIVKCIGNNNKLNVLPCSVDDLLWDNMENAYGFLYSKEYVNWRCECKNSKMFNVTDEDSNIVASCVYSHKQFNGSNITKVECVKIKAKDGKSYKKIWAFILNYLIQINPNDAFVRLWLDPCSYSNKTLKELGLLKSSHPNPFIIYPKPSFNQLDDFSDWNLSFFDLDY